MTEIWKGIVYQGKDYSDFYEISNTGKIRNSKTKREVKLQISPTGYLVYCGSIGGKGKNKFFKIHKALMESFLIENPENKLQINHKDGNKLNNSFENLEWCTNQENCKHAWETGLQKIEKHSGVNGSSSKLTEEDVIFIRENYIPYDKIFGSRALGKLFNIGHNAIINVAKKESYK